MPIIKVEHLGKKYILRHQQQGSYTALRDVITEKLKAAGNKLLHPFSAHSASSTNSSREDFWALNDVSFEVNEGDRIGIIGRNGAGKSTLLKILSRITEPTRGRVCINGRVASLLEVGTGFHPELTGRENIFLNGAILGMSRDEIKRKFDEIVDFAEVEKFLDTPVKHFSSGMYVRLAFAVAAHLEPEILLVDEVLAVGDAQFQKKCLGKMEDVSKSEGRTIIFVSHNMNMIETLCNKSIVFNNGMAQGPVSIRDGINSYLCTTSSNEKVYFGKPLTRAMVRQNHDIIEIIVEYKLENAINMPNLGFVISDHLGNPICGSNVITDCNNQSFEPSSNGIIKVIITQPKLLNGTYKLSLWFADSYIVYFSDIDCVVFDVVNMVLKDQLVAQEVGPVSTECKWHFS
jgi:lipopolysaccharide transport system ATP-binding protein